MKIPHSFSQLVKLNHRFYIIYIALSCFSAFLTYINFAYTNAFLMLGMLGLYFFAIPINLNYTNGKYFSLLLWLAIHALLCIFNYAWHYSTFGIRYMDGSISHDFLDCLYFSISTWATVGYGDFVATKPIRLLTSLQAITGVIFMPIAVALLWSMIKINTNGSDENIE